MRSVPRAQKGFSIAGLFVQMGLAKNESQAVTAMLVVTIVCIVGAVALLFFGMPREDTSDESYRIEMQGRGVSKTIHV